MIEKLHFSKTKTITLFTTILSMVLWSIFISIPAMAADTFTMNTDYPGVTMKPGETISFNLYFTNDGTSEYDVSLTADNLPDGWTGYFKGSNNEVSGVHIFAEQTKEDSPALSYSLTLPDTAEDGDYQFALKASTENGYSASLPLTVKVAQKESGQGNFTAEYPEQQGPTGTSFSFNTTIVNNSVSAKTYSLSAKVPDGWQVTFTPSGESSQVASLPVESGASQGMTVAVTPSENVEKGDYTIPCTAISADETLNLDLKVTITGTYGVTLTTPNGNLSANAYADKETPVTLSIQNTGNVDLTQLQLSASASTDWNVRFDETTIDTLEAGATKEITAYIQPSKDAIIGDYVTSITVKNEQTSSQMDLRVSVKNHTTWGIVAVVIIAALAAGLATIIKKYGRR